MTHPVDERINRLAEDAVSHYMQGRSGYFSSVEGYNAIIQHERDRFADHLRDLLDLAIRTGWRKPPTKDVWASGDAVNEK